MYLWLDPGSAAADFSDIRVTEANGHTVIRRDGQIVLQIIGDTGLDIGLRHHDANYPERGDIHTDLGGHVVDETTLDVTIDVFERYWT